MNPVPIGLIGVGFHARTVHIPALAVVPELRLMAVATSRTRTADEAAERYRVPGFADYRELLARADLDAVIVATPVKAFEAICRDALDAGKHVFLESPGVDNLAAAANLVTVAKRKRCVVQVGFLTRYSAPFEVLKSHLERQRPPRLFCYEYFPFLAHTFNLALYLSGPVERVIAATSDAAGQTATLRFRNGDTAVVIGRSLANCSVDIEAVRVSTSHFYGAVEGRRRVRVIENMKPVAVDDWSVASSQGTTYEPQVFAARFLESSGAAPQLRDFARAIRDGAQPRSTLEDAIETRALMQQIVAQTTASVETPQASRGKIGRE